MPYRDEKSKRKVDLGQPIGPSAGELTYRLQQVIDDYLKTRCILTGQLRYADLANCLGALEGCRVDFENRVLKPYENNKQAVNGDVWSPCVIREAQR